MTPEEKHYIEQGYILPEGFTWDRVQSVRQEFNIAAYMVPVATAPGCIAWAVPFKDGKPMGRLQP